MKNYFIDTNIFIRSLVNDEKEMSNESSLFLKNLETLDSNFFTSSVVVLEINFVLANIYDFPKTKIISIIKSISASRSVKIDDNVSLRLAVKLYQIHSVKFTDCLIASIKPIYEKKMTVISYDKDFDKLSIIRKTPSQIMK